jgi:ribosome-associated protein
MALKKRSKAAAKRPARAPTAPPKARQQGPSEDAQRMALAAATAALDKKASDVEIIDVTGKVDYADYLVLLTGQSDRHVGAIADAVDHALGKLGFNAISVEGMPRGDWVLIDFVDVVVHVFQETTRSLYDLDGLWMDAKRIRVPETVTGPR